MNLMVGWPTLQDVRQPVHLKYELFIFLESWKYIDSTPRVRWPALQDAGQPVLHEYKSYARK